MPFPSTPTAQTTPRRRAAVVLSAEEEAAADALLVEMLTERTITGRPPLHDLISRPAGARHL